MEIYSIGGYSEVGKNMTVVKTGEDAFIFDAGLHIPAVIEIQEEEKGAEINEKKLRRKAALPDDLILDDLQLRNKIRAIFLSHGHLDHIGAVPYLSYRYNAPVIGSPMTMSILKKTLEDEGKHLPNQLKIAQINSSIKIKGKNTEYTAEFVHMTHSIPHTTMVALYTNEGIVIYGNDFKLDNTPVMGNPPNYNTLRRMSKQGVKLLIADSLYCGSEQKTPSEKVARDMVGDVLSGLRGEKSSIFVTTFSSHIARLKSIVEFGKKIDRRVLFLGRTLNKYLSAASVNHLAPFRKDIEIKIYGNQLKSALKKVSTEKEKYMVVCTGHQGEPGSILDRISHRKLPFEFEKNDNVIFSSKTIPVPINIKNRGELDKRLKKLGARIYDNVHVSGHGSKEDIRELISILNPEHIIPSHGPVHHLKPMHELTKDLGYSEHNCHFMHNGQKVEIK
ncbi:RNase J family beta-CASP ribonuclease [Candidatus Pacearchaeota archaeon]|nr:RNase J family beta-CASP ribonuclease [Candidatus Pacearchaeota archaeon]